MEEAMEAGRAVAVRQARRTDLPGGAAVLSAAFQADPWFSWLYPDAAARPAQTRAWFGLLIDLAFGKGHTYVADHGFVNWIPPDVHFPEEDDVASAVSLLSGQIGDRARTALEVIGKIGPVFPDEPRFHCVYVGVDPGHHGTGTGTALLRRVLDACDTDGIVASLTSTNDANLPLYRRLGFEEIGAVPVPGGGFSMRPMRRPPGPG